MKNTSRRTFLRSGMALGIAAPLGLAEHKKLNMNSPQKSLPVVGHGNFRYKVDKSWGVQNPAKIPVNDCHEMVQDKMGRIILLTNHVKNNIIIYDRSGKVLKTWTGNWPGAHGLSIHDEGGEQFLYITENALHQVYKTTLDGKIVMTLDYPRENPAYTGADQFIPTETAVGPNGDLYVADGYGQNFITQYTSKGEYIRHFGGKGDGDGEFDCCHGICIDTRHARPTLLITSRGKQEFKRFSLDGQHMETISLPGCSICRPVIKDDKLYFAVIVTKSWWGYDGMVAVLNKENMIISLPGGSKPEYKEGHLIEPEYDGSTFLNPHDVCIDEDDNIYVSQWYSGRTYPVKLERV